MEDRTNKLAEGAEGVDISFCYNYVSQFNRDVSKAVKKVKNCVSAVEQSVNDFIENIDNMSQSILNVLNLANSSANECADNAKCVKQVRRHFLYIFFLILIDFV